MTSALRRAALAATTAALVGTALMAPARAAAPVDLQPEDLSRGADVAVAHIDAGDFVLGDRRVDVGGSRAYVLGRAGKAWLVGTSDANGGGRFRIVRVQADDTTKVIKRGISFFELKLSDNGRYFVHVGRGTRKSVPIRVFSSRTGKLKTEQSFANFPSVMGMGGSRVVLSTWTTGDTGTKSWDTTTGEVTTLTRRPANLVDIGNDLLASYTKDPYQGGCMVLSTLSDPTKRLWKSCSDRVEAFSPDGRRMATIGILSDGIGPSVVQEREIDGSTLATYSTGWFGRVQFEDDADLLLEVNGDTQAATVRCNEGACENATDPVAVQQPRTTLGQPARRFGSAVPGATR
ncbi:hypothetical protein [Nocardioides currus]|uniref:WD40 repeat domain-containing protein n=1 Tax=Nocardioides currus TaxID=2133958 RepID=A0A2R7YWA9_9ACTN|nr:hypothetical protein [Nocardioides currus]PUA80690.1 hypothetical protein C7S10_13135 [Nocardioides currus]